MRFIIVASISLIFLTIHGYSQQDSSMLDKFRSVYYTLPSPKADNPKKLPVSGIIVHDARPDTSCLGVMNESRDGDQFIRLKGGLTQLQQYYSLLIQNDTAAKGILHCFIKKLILSDYIDIPSAKVRTAIPKRNKRGAQSGLIFIAEFYEELDSIYYPLYRVDTTIHGSVEIQLDGIKYLTNGLQISLHKADHLNWEKVHRQPIRLSLQQIDSFNNAHLLVPALTEEPVKGIYFTFDEFKQNKPRITEYVIRKDKIGNLIYYKNEKGEEVPVLDAWGYCDGLNKYYHTFQDFFLIYRIGNGYTWYGTRTLKERIIPVPVGFPANGGIITGATGLTSFVKKIKHLCKLDLDTGKIY